MAVTMSTQTLDEAARLFNITILVDSLQIMDVGHQITVGINVTRELTAVGQPVAGVVQTTVLENAVESQVASSYSIKVPKKTPLHAGQAVKVLLCRSEPELEGRVLLVDKVSHNGLSMLRKAVASDFDVVDQQGKEGLS